MIYIIQHAENEGPGMIGDYFSSRHYSVKTIKPYIDGCFPARFEWTDSLIIMGGPMSAYQDSDFPFMSEEVELIKYALRKGVPVLGICLGAQLMARALGARVIKAPSREIGWDRVRLTCKGVIDPVFNYMDTVLDVFQWHEDMFEVPENSLLLAESTVCPQVFKAGKNSYGFQCHFEATPEMIEDWVSSGELSGGEMLREAYAKKEQYVIQAKKILDNFSQIMTRWQGLPCEAAEL